MDYQIGSSCHRQLTNGKDTWSARCGESRTPGAESGSGKRTGRKVGTAPRPDSTSVPDADAAAQTVERLGGTVRVAPTDLDAWGRMAQLSDPLGGQFAAWQPGTTKGVDLVDAPGSLSWVELYTTDAAAAKEFYGEVFGWSFAAMDLQGDAGEYDLITPAGLPEERMHGGVMEMTEVNLTLTDGRPYWHPVFGAEDCDAAVAKVTENGGSIQMGPEDVPDVGRLAVCLDPWNADFVLLAAQRPTST